MINDWPKGKTTQAQNKKLESVYNELLHIQSYMEEKDAAIGYGQISDLVTTLKTEMIEQKQGQEKEVSPGKGHQIICQSWYWMNGVKTCSYGKCSVPKEYICGMNLPETNKTLRDELNDFVRYLNEVRIFDQKYVVDNYLSQKH